MPSAPPPGPMHEGRWAAMSTLLPDGRVLVAGGYSFARKDTLISCDLFHPETGAFTPAAPLHFDRNFACAVLLSDGRVLVMGGFSETGGGTRGTAEVYDSKADTWAMAAGPMNERRELFTATQLPGGKILLAGGLSLQRRRTLAPCEIYEVQTGAFRPTRHPLHNDRFGHAAASLPDGRILVMGGQSWKIGQPSETLASAEVFDPSAETWQIVGPPRFARDRPTATLLLDGRVLIAGGASKGVPPLSAEIYDPKTRQFSLAGELHEGRMAHDAVRLLDGRVVVAGGWSDARKATTPTVEIYDPKADAWQKLPDLPFSAHDLNLVAFPNGRVLALGGKSTQNDEKTAVSIDRAVWLSLSAPH